MPAAVDEIGVVANAVSVKLFVLYQVSLPPLLTVAVNGFEVPAQKESGRTPGALGVIPIVIRVGLGTGVMAVEEVTAVTCIWYLPAPALVGIFACSSGMLPVVVKSMKEPFVGAY